MIVRVNNKLISYWSWHSFGKYLATISLSVMLLLFLDTRLVSAFEPGSPYKLSHTLASNADVFSDFKFTPDGKTLVYRAKTSGGDIDLFSVSLVSGTISNLSEFTIGDVTSFVISADSNKVAFVTFNESSLYISILGTGSLFRASNSTLQIYDYGISPDSSYVVFRARTSSPFIATRLYRTSLVDPAGSLSLVGEELVQNGNIESGFIFVPGDKNEVVYRGDVLEDEVFELFKADLDVPNVDTKLSGSMVSGGDVESDFSVSADGEMVVYRADARINNVVELYSKVLESTLPPTNAIKLNPNLVAGRGVADFEVSPDSTRVVYRADARANDDFELFSVPIGNSGGNLAVRISDTLIAGGDVIDYKITPNSNRVVYRADQDIDNVLRLYSASIIALSVSPLSPNINGADDVLSDYKFSNFGARVVYRIREQGALSLFSVNVSGGSEQRLSPQFGGNVLNTFDVISQLDRVFYLADQENFQVFELFSSAVAAPLSSNVQLNEPLAALSGKDVTDFVVSSDANYLVYRADQDNDQKFELYAVNLDESGFCVPMKASNGNVAVVCL